MLIQLPEDVKAILHTLQSAGYEAYAVGGCIRDSILGREPEDWDITTSAKPEETKALFGKTIDTGIQHGTVTVMRHGRGYEVTTYRVDGEYEDGRHPKEVTFTASLAEDLRRRDFTVNAMACNEEDGLVDLFGGQEDLKRESSAAWASRTNVFPRTRCASCGRCASAPSWALRWRSGPGRPSGATRRDCAR